MPNLHYLLFLNERDWITATCLLLFFQYKRVVLPHNHLLSPVRRSRRTPWHDTKPHPHNNRKEKSIKCKVSDPGQAETPDIVLFKPVKTLNIVGELVKF